MTISGRALVFLFLFLLGSILSPQAGVNPQIRRLDNFFPLTIIADEDEGGITTPLPGTYWYAVGQEVKITAHTMTDYRFKGWTGDVPSGHEMDNPVTIKIDGIMTIRANWVKRYPNIISGHVTDSVDGKGIEGVVMKGLPSTVTDANGYYYGDVATGSGARVTPQKAGYAFKPTQRYYFEVKMNYPNENYTGTRTFIVSGKVETAAAAGQAAAAAGLGGVLMSGLPGDPQTDDSGNYAATVTYDWSGTVIPTKSGYNFDPAYRSYSNVTSDQTAQDYAAAPEPPPLIHLSRNRLNFGAQKGGPTTSAQSVLLSNMGGSTLDWTVSSDRNWLVCSPSMGTGGSMLSISADHSGLSSGTYEAVLTVASTKAANSPQTIAIHLIVKEATECGLPIGSFDTPIDGTTGVAGAIPVTGWAVDDIDVLSVEIKREPWPGEIAGAAGTDGLIFVGNGTFVEGARPDIEATFSSNPNNDRAGWGYMMLTNALPNHGNGTYKLHAFVQDAEGNTVSLGAKIITCSNATSIKPFGTIDSPLQGGQTAGAAYANFGWALTPLPKTIPKNGSTISVYIDGVLAGNLQTPPNVYDQFRPDVSAAFPSLNNSSGPVGAFFVDTTAYANGVHTIAWIVVDDNGQAEGIGSRYFTILNTEAGAAVHEIADPGQRLSLQGDNLATTKLLSKLPSFRGCLGIKLGFGPRPNSEIVLPDSNGLYRLAMPEVGRIEISLRNGLDKETVRYSGYLLVRDNVRMLPVGSSLDHLSGSFSWMPVAGFIGAYDLIFLVKDAIGLLIKIPVQVSIIPRFEKKP